MQPLEFLHPADLEAIHQTSMKVLAKVGICFPEGQALDIFKKHGFRTDGEIVYFTEDQVFDAIKDVPEQFSIQARNPARKVTIGNGIPIFAPGYGAPFLIDPELGKRIPGLLDYENLIRIAHSLPHQDLSGHMLVEPQDVPRETAHLYMLQANIRYSDKPFIGSSAGKIGAQHTIELLRILFGENLEDYFTLGLINPLSPLRYSKDTAQAIIVYAQANQPLVFAALVMAGSTGPITIPGVIAQQNAELLAGIVLAQLIRPGLPILYGSTSTNMDMKTGALAIGSPELSLCLSIHTQLGRKYKFPVRGGGALTDSSTVDAQAGYESMFSLLTTLTSGIDFILHSAGILSSYLAFSFEKFVLDDELCGMVKHYFQGVEVNQETLAWDVIKNVGHNGHYLNQPHTLEKCRTEFWIPEISDRSGMEAWWGSDRLDATDRASIRCRDLLANYQQPVLDPILEKQIQDFINNLENS